MKIISIRRGFASDHSSTSYEFYAIDKPLTNDARRKVSSLSSRANPTKRGVRFVYNVDGYDIPGSWESLMCNYYDVMARNEYDWWTLAMAFDASEEQQAEISRYKFEGVEDMGVSVSTFDKRVIVTINCQLDSSSLYDIGDAYQDEYGDEEEEEEGEEAAEDTQELDVDTGSPLLDLLAEVRDQLIHGDYRALYAVWEEYGCEDEGEEEPKPPVPSDKPTGTHIVEQFRNLLTEP